MKKIFSIAILCFFTLSTNAQELNFDETVIYIQNKVKDFQNETLMPNDFTAKKNGELEVGGSKFNIFDLNNKQKKDLDKTDEFGLEIAHPSLVNYGVIPGIIFMADGRGVASLRFKDTITLAEIQRIKKAIIHLRSLCTKEKDPFDK